jgi:hypothetical protein
MPQFRVNLVQIHRPAIPNLAIKPDGFPKYRQFSLIFKSATSLLHKIMPKPVRFGFEFGIAVHRHIHLTNLIKYITMILKYSSNRIY